MIAHEAQEPSVNSVQLKKLRKRALSLVFFTIFLDLVGFGMFIPILPSIALSFEATAKDAAALSTYFSIGTALAVIVFGRLSDSFGRKKILVLTILLSAVAQLLTGFVGTYLWLAVMRFVAGIAAGNISVAQATIADVTIPKERGRSMVIVGLAFGAGFAVGPAIGALVARMAEGNELQALSVTAFILNVINLFLVASKLPETHHKFAQGTEMQLVIEDVRSNSAATLPTEGKKNFISDLRGLFRTPFFKVVILLQFLQIFGFSGIEVALPILLQQDFLLARKDIFDTFVIMGIMILFFNGYVTRKLLAKIGEIRTLNLGQLTLGIGILLLPLVAPSRSLMYLALTFVIAGTSFANPSLSALVSRLAPQEKQGLSFGSSQAIGTTARIFGPLFIGYLYSDFGGIQSLYVSSALMILGCFVGIAGLFRLHRKFKNDERVKS